MQQPLCQAFKLQGHSIQLNLRIEIVANSDQREPLTSYGVSEAVVDGNRPPVGNSEVPLQPVQSNDTSGVNQEIDEEDLVANLKERLERAESGCLRLEELYRKYRLRWLEECYRARVLEEHAPYGIDTCSACQIPWDAPSPVQGDDGEVEGI